MYKRIEETVTNPRYKYSQYKEYKSRLKTFNSWPDSSNLKPENLASAGFFYLGTNESVACFDCGGAILTWELQNEPLNIHKMMYPHCQYVKKKMTQISLEQRHQLQPSADIDMNKLVFLYAIRCLSQVDIDDFFILPHANRYWETGDFIICIKYKNNDRKLFIFENLKSVELIIDERNLRKYQTVLNEIRTQINSHKIFQGETKSICFVLQTTLNPNDIPMEIKLMEVEDDSLKILNSSHPVYKLKSTEIGDVNQDFLDNFFLAFEGIINFDKAILDELDNLYGNIITKQAGRIFNENIQNWDTTKYNICHALFKEDILEKLQELLVMPYVIPPGKYDVEIDDTVKMELWREATMNFDFAVFTEEKSIKSILACIKNELSSGTVEKLNSEAPYLTSWELSRIPSVLDCQTKEDFDKIIKMLDITSKNVRHFIVYFQSFSDEFEYPDLPGYRKFRNLTDLPPEVSAKFLNIAKVSLQGKEFINLADLLAEENYHRLKPDLFVDFLFENVIIGPIYDVPRYYTTRRFKKILLNKKVLEKLMFDKEANKRNKKKVLFVIQVSEENKERAIAGLVKFHIINLNQLIFKTGFNLDLIKIIIATRSKMFDIIDTIETSDLKSERDPIHFLKYHDSHEWYEEDEWNTTDRGVFEWVYSFGKTKKLKPFLIDQAESPYLLNDESLLVKDTEALDYFETQAQILSSNPGMGKTSVLQFMASNYRPEYWTVSIDLADKQSYNEKHTLYENLMYCLDVPKKKENLYTSLFETSLGYGKVIFLMNDYNKKMGKKITGFVKSIFEISKTHLSKLWISTNSSSKDFLENELKTLSFELTYFSRDDQKEFLRKYLSIEDRISETSKLNTIENAFDCFNEKFIGTPLQTRMVIDVLHEKNSDYFSNFEFNLADIYEHFLAINKINRNNLVLISKLALTHFFDEDILQSLMDLHEFKSLNLEFLSKVKDRSGQLILSEYKCQKNFTFSHKTYAEYFAARWIAQNSKRDTVRRLIDLLFSFELCGVKMFFDNIIASGCPLHLAVLNNNILCMHKILRENHSNMAEVISLEDGCGRTAAHIAASYGASFDFFTQEDVTGLKCPDQHCTSFKFCTFTDVIIPQNIGTYNSNGNSIFSLLLYEVLKMNKNRLKRKDYFGYDLFDYALKSGCLKILENLQTNIEDTKKEQNIFFLYHCIKNGLNHLILNTVLRCLCRVRFHRESLIFLAVTNCSMESIEAIFNFELDNCEKKYQNVADIINSNGLLHSLATRLENEDKQVIDLLLSYDPDVDNEFEGSVPIIKACCTGNLYLVSKLIENKANIDDTDQWENTALHRSVQYGFDKCLEELCEAGASLNERNVKGMTPVHVASFYNQSNCLEKLLLRGAEVNKKDKSGFTPLHRAVQNDYVDCARILLRFGANIFEVNHEGKNPEEVAKMNTSGQCLDLFSQESYTQGINLRSPVNTNFQKRSANNVEITVKIPDNGNSVFVEEMYPLIDQHSFPHPQHAEIANRRQVKQTRDNDIFLEKHIHSSTGKYHWDTSGWSELHVLALQADFLRLLEHIENSHEDEINSLAYPESYTALHTLILGNSYDKDDENFMKCARLLLENSIDINHGDLENQSAILYAAERSYKSFIEYVLEEFDDLIDIDNYKQNKGRSARQFIIHNQLYLDELPEEKPFESLEFKQKLLITIRTGNEREFFKLSQDDEIFKYLNMTDGKNEDIAAYTLLQLSIELKQTKIAVKLLELGADCFKSVRRNEKRPADKAIENFMFDFMRKVFELCDVKGKFDPALINHHDENPLYNLRERWTLLHDAAYKVQTEYIFKLLENGASLFTVHKGRIPLDYLKISILNDHLTDCMLYNPEKDPDFCYFNYKSLIVNSNQLEIADKVSLPLENNRKISYRRQDTLETHDSCLIIDNDKEFQEVDETRLLSVISESNKLKNVITHPVICALIDLKIARAKWIYRMNLLVYILFCIIFHLYVLFKNSYFFYILLALTLTLLGRETFQLFTSVKKREYFKDVENFLEIILIATTLSLLISDFFLSGNERIRWLEWKYLGPFCVLLSTMELLFLIGKHYCTHPITMYRNILIKFLKYIAPFFLLFFSFTVSFIIMSSNEMKQDNKNSNKTEEEENNTEAIEKELGIFYSIFSRTFTAILMFSGEVNAETLYSGEMLYVGRIIIICFILLMTIILANLLLSLTISDVQELRNTALKDEYLAKAKYILHIESCVKKFKHLKISRFLEKMCDISLFGGKHKTKIKINLVDNDELDQEQIDAICEIICRPGNIIL